jgi:hypothetical protein
MSRSTKLAALTACSLVTICLTGCRRTYQASIDKPEDWQKGNATQGVDLVYMSPVERNDTFRENVNLVHEDIPPFTDVSGYVDANLKNMNPSFEGFSVVERKETTLAGEDAVLVVYDATAGPGQKMRAMAYFVVKGDRGFVVTCSSTPKSIDRYRAVFEKCAQSITFTQK